MVAKDSSKLSSGNYRISVEDFGPIVGASVDLRPLTVFVGPSNTGKSYLAILIYALHQFFCDSNDVVRQRVNPLRIGRHLVVPALENFTTDARFQERWTDFLTNMHEKNTISSLPKEIAAIVRSILEQPKIEVQLEAEIRRCFGVEDCSDLVRRPSNSSLAKIGLGIPQEGEAQEAQYVLEIRNRNSHFSGKISDQSMTIGTEILRELQFVTKNIFGIKEIRSDFADERKRGTIWWSLVHSFFRSLTLPLNRDAFYLPADRTGVMHSHQVVVSTLIKNAAAAGLRPTADVPMLSGVLADFLNSLILLSDSTSQSSSADLSRNLSEILERDILEGTINISRAHANYPVFSYKPAGWKNNLPLMRTSSMVSELAPVVLYLRHLVKSGDLLIIEEPESHLHPAMQAAFARELARLVRSGIRVILTTHSEWFLEKLGNLVRLGELIQEKRDRFVDVECALQPEEIGVWLFARKRKPKGTFVMEVPLDSETGLYPTDFDSVREALYNEGADFFNLSQASVDE